MAEFEYSQQYLFFWDKLEKANCSILREVGLIVDFLECMIDLADEPLDSRLVQHLLSSPIGDGGQFDMVIVFPPLHVSLTFRTSSINTDLSLKRCIQTYTPQQPHLVSTGSSPPNSEKMHSFSAN